MRVEQEGVLFVAEFSMCELNAVYAATHNANLGAGIV